MKNFILLLSLSFSLLGCKNENSSSSSDKSLANSEDITTKIAMANGYANFEGIEQLNFTFNVKVNDTLRSSRSWQWYPQEERVVLTENGESSSYINDEELTDQEKETDQKFINDTYWLLFPFQLIWSDYDYEHKKNAVAPISGKEMDHLIVKYAGEGGYTPGDTYHLYFNEDDFKIKEWTYESSTGRSLTTTWEDYKTFSGVDIARMHQSEDGSFQLFFTDVNLVE